MPTWDYTSYKLTFCDAQAAVQFPDLASVNPNLSMLKRRISQVEVRKFNICQERIYGEVPQIRFRDSEQFQGFCISGNETPVAVLVNVTLASGTTAPDWSRTVPTTDAVSNCARADEAHASSRIKPNRTPPQERRM